MFKYKQEKYKRDRECAKHSIAAHVIAASKLASSTSVLSLATATQKSLSTSSTLSLVKETFFSSPATTVSSSLVVMASKHDPPLTSSVSALSTQGQTILCSHGSSSRANGTVGNHSRQGCSLLQQMSLQKSSSSNFNDGGGSIDSIKAQQQKQQPSVPETCKKNMNALTSDFWSEYFYHMYFLKYRNA